MATLKIKNILQKSLTLDPFVLNQVIDRIVISWDKDTIACIIFNETPYSYSVAKKIVDYFGIHISDSDIVSLNRLYLDDAYHLKNNNTIEYITPQVVIE